MKGTSARPPTNKLGGGGIPRNMKIDRDSNLAPFWKYDFRSYASGASVQATRILGNKPEFVVGSSHVLPLLPRCLLERPKGTIPISQSERPATCPWFSQRLRLITQGADYDICLDNSTSGLRLHDCSGCRPTDPFPLSLRLLPCSTSGDTTPKDVAHDDGTRCAGTLAWVGPLDV